MFKRVLSKKRKPKQKNGSICNPCSRDNRTFNTHLIFQQSDGCEAREGRSRKRCCNLTNNDSILRSKSVPPSIIYNPRKRDSSTNRQKQVRFDHTARFNDSVYLKARSPPPRKLKSALKRTSGDLTKKRKKCKCDNAGQEYQKYGPITSYLPLEQTAYIGSGSVDPFFSGYRDGDARCHHSKSYERANNPKLSSLDLKLSNLKLKYSEYKLPSGVINTIALSPYSNSSSNKFQGAVDNTTTYTSTCFSPYLSYSRNKYHESSNKRPNINLSSTIPYPNAATNKFQTNLSLDTTSKYTSPFSNVSTNKSTDSNERIPTGAIRYSSAHSNKSRKPINRISNYISSFSRKDNDFSPNVAKYQTSTYATSSPTLGRNVSSMADTPSMGWSPAVPRPSSKDKARPYSADGSLRNYADDSNTSDSGFELKQMDLRRRAMQKIRRKEDDLIEKYILNPQRKNSPEYRQDTARPSDFTLYSKPILAFDFDKLSEKLDAGSFANTNFNKDLSMSGGLMSYKQNASQMPFSYNTPNFSSEPSVSQAWKDVLGHTRNMGESSKRQSEDMQNESNSRGSGTPKPEIPPSYVGVTTTVGRPTGYREFLKERGVSPTNVQHLEVNQVNDFLKEIKPIPKSEGSQLFTDTGLCDFHSADVRKNSDFSPVKKFENFTEDRSFASLMDNYKYENKKNAWAKSDTFKKPSGIGGINPTFFTGTNQSYRDVGFFLKDEGDRLEKLNAILDNTYNRKIEESVDKCNTSAGSKSNLTSLRKTDDDNNG